MELQGRGDGLRYLTALFVIRPLSYIRRLGLTNNYRLPFSRVGIDTQLIKYVFTVIAVNGI